MCIRDRGTAVWDIINNKHKNWNSRSDVKDKISSELSQLGVDVERKLQSPYLKVWKSVKIVRTKFSYPIWSCNLSSANYRCMRCHDNRDLGDSITQADFMTQCATVMSLVSTHTIIDNKVVHQCCEHCMSRNTRIMLGTL